MRLITLRLGKITALLLFIVFLGEHVALAASNLDAASVKQQIAARGVGRGIKVHEADGTVLSGKIVSVKDDSFRLQMGSAPSVEIAYENVRAVEKRGISTGAKIGIGFGIGVVVSAAVVAIIVDRSLSHW